jgi:DNA-binding SARP family transcriptional activator
MWEAVDVRTDRPVVAHLYPEQAAPQERFLREARALAGTRHPNVVPVLDFGVEGETPYLIAEFVDGVTLTELEAGSGPGVSFRVLARLTYQVAEGLRELHSRSLVRGQGGPDGLLLRPDGTVVISRFALGEESRGMDAESDLDEFTRLLQDLAAHLTAAPGESELLTPIENGDLSEAARSARRSGAVHRAGVGFRLLGPLGISSVFNWRQGSISTEAQALLCMLLLRHGSRVTFTELAEGLWEEPPSEREAVGRIHPLANELRELLGPGTLAALADGYALHVPEDYIDVRECEELLGRRTSGQDPGTQRSLIQDALDLWQGDPLDGIPGPAAEAARTRLRTLHLDLCISRAKLDLELLDFEHAANLLAPLVLDHPEHEELRRLHTLARRELGRLTDAPEQSRSTIVFEAAGLSENPRAHDALGRAVARLLAAGELAPDQFELLARDNGYVVLTEPTAQILPVLTVALQTLPVLLGGELDEDPRVRVTFWHAPWFGDPGQDVVPPDVRAALDSAEADITVVVSPALYEELASRSAIYLAVRFEPLAHSTSGGPPPAWYCPLDLQTAAPEPEDRDLVRGPFTTHDLPGLTAPDPGLTAIVHTQPGDAPLTLLNPARPHGTRPPRLTTYYEVDLTTQRAAHEVALPSSGGGAFAASVELSWYVDDPVAFVHGQTVRVSERLLDHFLKEAARITRRHPLRRTGAAQHALRSGLRRWPVPGLSVTCSVVLTPEGEPPPAQEWEAPEPP